MVGVQNMKINVTQKSVLLSGGTTLQPGIYDLNIHTSKDLNTGAKSVIGGSIFDHTNQSSINVTVKDLSDLDNNKDVSVIP